MHTHSNTRRWLTAGLLTATVLSLASPALAANGRRYKGVTHANRAERVVIRQHSSDAGPALAGLIGGFILGAALTSNAHPVVVHERVYHRPRVVVRYYDPYEDIWYDSLDQCEFGRSRHHSRIIYVIDTRSGHRLRTLRYREGGWHRYDGDDDRSYG